LEKAERVNSPEECAEPGGANGDEPFSSVSIATSVAAHPRRSPLALAVITRMDLLQPFKHLVTTSRRITISRGDSGTGSRIGGSAPEGVVPPFVNAATRYFVTIALDDKNSQELSVFVSIDWSDETSYEPSNPNTHLNNLSKLMTSDCPLVQCVVHPSAPRSESSLLASDLIGRALMIEEERPDILVEIGGELLLGSKIGGRPYFHRNAPAYIEALDHLFDQDFCLLLQYTEGGYERGCRFLSPFDEDTFHLLAQETPVGIVWRYGWG